MEQKLKNDILPKIVNYYSPKKVILFGSVARGDNVYSSDLDIVVIADSNKSFKERLKETIHSMEFENVDILVYTPEEFDTMVRVENQFITNIVKEGKVIYEQEG